MTTRRRKHQETRRAIQRSVRPVKPLLQTMLVRPEEFAGRLRQSLKAGRNPRRLLKCVDDLEAALSHRGISMRAYFASLRKEVERATLRERAKTSPA